MTDAMLVALLFVFIWAAILIPPAAGARAAREADFLGSIRPGRDPLEGTLGRSPDDSDGADPTRFRPGLTANARRRQVLGGLVVAMGATLVLGLLPTFHLLLVVHLFLVNSCLAYVGVLVHLRDLQTDRARPQSARPALVDDPVGLPHYALARREDPASFDFSTLADTFRADAFGADDEDDADQDEPAYAAAVSGYAEYDRYDDDLEYEGYDEYDAEAAYVDELGLARPA